MGVPKPQDPRAGLVSPVDVEKRLVEVLERPVSSLHEEAEVLAEAHELLSKALQ